jgi:hypothetical protein
MKGFMETGTCEFARNGEWLAGRTDTLSERHLNFNACTPEPQSLGTPQPRLHPENPVLPSNTCKINSLMLVRVMCLRVQYIWGMLMVCRPCHECQLYALQPCSIREARY